MRRSNAIRQSITTALFLFALVSVATRAIGCFPADKKVEAAVGYEAQQVACIDRNDTKAAIDACRDRVKAAWMSTDAGGDR